MKKSILVMVHALIVGTTVWAIDGTNVWSGAASGGNWSVPANWTAKNSSYTAEELLSLNCVYDVSALADGAALTNNTTDLKIAGLVTKANQGTLTFSGNNFLWMGKPQLFIEAGTTIKWQMNHPNNWNTKDGTEHVILLGGGTFRLEPTSDFTFYKRGIQACNTLTLVIASTRCYLQLSYLYQYDSSTVRLEQDLTVGYHIVGHDACKLDLNGHNLYVSGGESYWSTPPVYRGMVMGTGGITHFGGWTGRAYSAYDFDGWLALYTGDFEFKSGATISENVRLIANGPGRFIFPADQTLANLSGEGAVGGVQMADNTTLTLTGTAVRSPQVFGARIYGKTDVVKNGPDYEQVLTGENAYTGGTTVAAGTLTLRRPICRKGLAAYWPFDDANDLGRDFGPNGLHLSSGSIASGVATQSLSGVAYRPALQLDKSSVGTGCGRYEVSGLNRTNNFPTGNDPITVSFWTRPAADNPDVSYLFREGNWGGNGTQMTIWQRVSDRINVCIVNWSTSDGPNSPVVSCPGLTDGQWHHIAVSYAARSLKVYYDGELTSEKTTTYDLAIPSSASLMFGNNDSSGGNTGANHRFYGGIDEACVWNRALTAAEVKEEYERSHAAVADPATLLPDPVCQWTFDDASDLGKDTMGHASLVANDKISPTPSSQALERSYGRCITYSTSMKLPAADFPENVPTGSAPFTVSVRLFPGAPTETSNVLFWGDPAVATNSFRLRFNGCPRRLEVVAGTANPQRFSWSNNSTPEQGGWTHVVIVGDPSRRILKMFRDGRRESTRTDFDINILAQDLYLNCNNAGTSYTGCLIDDVRIFDQALTDDEAITLSRSLEKGAVGAVIPANSDVEVALGATLKVEGEGHVVKSLAGAGEVFLNGPSTLQPGTADALTGTVRGTGTLVLDVAMANATVSANVAIPDGADLAADSLPLATTSGTLFVPANGTVTFAAHPQPGRYVIATGTQAEAATDLAGWTAGNINPDGWGTSFSLVGGAFVLDVTRRGLMVIIR
ncbi:MAG TPA: hypothetical protein PKM57_09040 [Kiritimatiellia bacterium]|nr:hypothetical protein [Kiritimatiellia bacterium]